MFLAQESDRWRQFCIQYAKSVAFKFAESWQQYSTNAAITQSNVPISDIIEQFTNTLSDELTERLATPNVILPATTFLQSVCIHPQLNFLLLSFTCIKMIRNIKCYILPEH